MMDTEIIDMLEDIGRSSVARLSPGVVIAGETASERRDLLLRAIRKTILPRRLEFTSSTGDVWAIEVNSSRVTDVFRTRSGQVPDFGTEPREDLIEKTAHLLSDIASAPAPLEMLSLKPDGTVEADDVGITLSEIENACGDIDLPEEHVISIVPDVPKEDIEEHAAEPSENLALAFFEGAERFSTGRILTEGNDPEALRLEGTCAPGGEKHAGPEILSRFAADLAGWRDDTGETEADAQLMVMRPTGGKGAGLAVVTDRGKIAIAVHDARKLGAVVNLWTSIEGAAE